MKKIILLALSVFLGTAMNAHAANLSNLNGLTTATQTFTNDKNIRINSSGSVHTITWTNQSLAVDRGGTGRKSLVAGQLLFGDTAASISQSAQLFWDRTNSRLGIGTSTPSSKLAVTGGVSIGGNYASVSAPTNGLIVEGNVGIGITTPAYKLDVNGDVHATQVVTNTVSAVGANQSIHINPTGTGKVIIGGDSLVVASKSSEPTNPQIGQIYFDTTLGKFRGYNGSSWISFQEASTASSASVSVLVVAGGGGGGARTNGLGVGAGGGGAGGMQQDDALTVTPQAYTITVGNFGAGGAGTEQPGVAGGNSSFDSLLVSTGGGGGGGANGGSGGGGGAGGSGGGASGNGGPQKNGGAGTAGQGNNGASVDTTGGGGGGGKSTTGVDSGTSSGGAGGTGLASSISGASVTYAAGGAGGNDSGDGNGAVGAANTGNGGGGAQGNAPSGGGGAGGSGIVIISYPTGSITATGGAIDTTTIPGTTIHTFSTVGSASFTVTAI